MLTKKISRIFYNSLSNSAPNKLINKKIIIKNKSIIFQNKKIFSYKNKLYIISIGKASQSLLKGFLKFSNEINDYFVVRHFISKKTKSKKENFINSTHPLVSKKSYIAAKRLIQFINKIPINSDVIFLISGGGSAMLAHPVNGISFIEKSKFINNLLHIGIGEREVNFFRKKLSSIKSSKTLSYFKNSNILNIILSDERSNKIDAISSGISIPQSQKVINSELLKKVTSQKFCSKKIKNLLIKNNKKEPKNNYSNKVTSIIIGDRFDLIKQLQDNFKTKLSAKNVIYYGHIFEKTFEMASNKIEKIIKNFYNNGKSGLNILIFTGEIPVKANLKSKGGRNQHLSAVFIDKINDLKNFSFCCFSTDGCDYLKGIHGAYIDDIVIKKIFRKNINYKNYIKKTNTYYLHKKTDSLIYGDYSDNNFSDFYIFSFIK